MDPCFPRRCFPPPAEKRAYKVYSSLLNCRAESKTRAERKIPPPPPIITNPSSVLDSNLLPDHLRLLLRFREAIADIEGTDGADGSGDNRGAGVEVAGTESTG